MREKFIIQSHFPVRETCWYTLKVDFQEWGCSKQTRYFRCNHFCYAISLKLNSSQWQIQGSCKGSMETPFWNWRLKYSNREVRSRLFSLIEQSSWDTLITTAILHHTYFFIIFGRHIKLVWRFCPELKPPFKNPRSATASGSMDWILPFHAKGRAPPDKWTLTIRLGHNNYHKQEKKPRTIYT